MLRFKLSYSNASHYSSSANMKYLEINGIDETDIREFIINLIYILDNINKTNGINNPTKTPRIIEKIYETL